MKKNVISLKKVRTNLGLTQTEVAEKLGLSLRTYQRYESNPNELKFGQIGELSDKLGVSIGDIIGNKEFDENLKAIGNTLKPVNDMMQNLKKVTTLNLPKLTNKQQLLDTIALNFHPHLSASAGYGRSDDNYEVVTINVTKDALKEIFKIPYYKEVDIVKVVGDSMEPFVSDGESVIIDKKKQAVNGNVVIAYIGDDMYIKRFLRVPNKGVKLSSFNDHYPDIELNGDEVDTLKIIGVVIAKYDMKVKIF